MNIFEKNNFEERKSLLDVFLEYRHFKLEDVLKKINNIPDEEEQQDKKDEDDDFIKVNLTNSTQKNDIDEEFKEEK